MPLQCEIKSCKNVPAFVCVCLENEHLLCKEHFMNHLGDSSKTQHKSVCLLPRIYSPINSCNNEDIISSKCYEISYYKKIPDTTSRLLVYIIQYAEQIFSLNWSKRKTHTSFSQNSCYAVKPEFLFPKTICSGVIYRHNELNYKLARSLSDHILQISSPSALLKSYVNKINFINHKDFLSCFKNIMTDMLREKLLDIILQSKINKKLKYSASNAITILNYSKYNFINKDLRGIQIEGADLSEALIINTDFQGSNLKRVNFSYANIYDSNFRNCDLSDAWLGQIPPVISTYPANSVAFSFCGNYLAFDCRNTVIMHDIKTGLKFQEFKHSTNITAISFSKDGTLLAVADSNYIVNLWDIKCKKLVTKLAGHTDTISSIAISPDRNFVATGSYDDSLRIWNIETYMRDYCISYAKDVVSSVAFSSCGKYFAYGTHCKSAIVSYVDNISSRKWVFYHSDSVRAVSFSPCSKYLITSCENLVITIWDLEIGRLIKKIRKEYHPMHILKPSMRYHSFTEQQISFLKFLVKHSHSEAKWFNEQLFNMWSVSYSPNGKYIAIKKSDTSGKSIEIWDIRTLEEHPFLYNEITTISFSYDGKYIAVADTSSLIMIKDAETKKNKFKLKSSKGIIIYVKFLKFGYFLISLCSRNYITVWDAENQYPLKEFIMGNIQVSAIDIAFNDKIIATGQSNGEVKVWDLTAPSNYFFLKCSVEFLTCINFSPCGKYLATACNNKKLLLWELGGRKSLELDGHKQNLLCMSFVQSTNYLVSADAGGQVILWDIEAQWKILEIQADDQMIPSIAVSLCGDYLITGTLNGCVKIWNTWEGTLIKEIKYHSNAVDSLKFLNNKKLEFASVSADNTFKLCRL
ncbi:unnamed protein product [Blepharisma stoltei]|uniref:Uncharacterized protein n=1 Tax=Blepharisma stoltei TaxID=1481888 RepID=A0AAU9I812_9CILI|nr:unnamed protein product [Blepharisma stoltei]